MREQRQQQGPRPRPAGQPWPQTIHRHRRGRGRRAGAAGLRTEQRAVRAGQAIGLDDTELVWQGLYDAVSLINDELTEITVSYGSRLRRVATLELPGADDLR